MTMIDIATPTSVRSRRKKELQPVRSLSKENETDNIKALPKKKRKVERTANPDPKEEEEEVLVESTVPDEDFMLPVSPPEEKMVTFVRTEKELEEPLIPSDPDDPANSIPLANFVGCRRVQAVPERSLKLNWSHKRKELRKSKARCQCYTTLERETLEKLCSPKVLKSKRRFTQHFNEFEEAALQHQCPAAPSSSLPIKSSAASTRLVKKSLKHQLCPKTKSAHISGAKRKRHDAESAKARFSKFFINEVVRLMLESRVVWSLEILAKLIKTRQLTSGNVMAVGTALIGSRDFLSFKLLISCTRSCNEKHTVQMLLTLLSDPLYSAPCDGADRQLLDSHLSLLLSLPFDPASMKRSLKVVSPSMGRTLLTVLGEQFLKSAPIKTWKLNLAQAVQWCDVLVEVFFAALTRDTELVRQIYNTISLHIASCRSVLSLNEHLFRVKYPSKFRKAN